MEGGQDLSSPPVRIWSVLAKAQLATMLRGSALYSMGAGGFSTVPALPRMIRIKQPANPNSAQAVQDTQLYTQKPATIKQRLESQFGASG